MDFDRQNKIVRLCLQGMAMEAKGDQESAGKIFLQAWEEATNDFEKFTAAYYVARNQKDVQDKQKWMEISLQLAQKIDNDTVRAAYPHLALTMAKYFEDLKDEDHARKYRELADSFPADIADKGPFYHGTKADLPIGSLLTAGNKSNYQSHVVMNHVYFTALPNGAGLAAALAKGEGRERVYIVEPTGSFENDPNVTNKKFPGNPTRSYRTDMPLKIVGEITDWVRPSLEELRNWREKLAGAKGEIIN
jgi:rifampin ADP-ribosylating transferase